MNYWLMKSDAEDYTIDDLKRDKIEPWTGVRNFQARNFMRDVMEIGDMVIFWHSGGKPIGAAGIGKIVSKSYPDKTQFNKKSKYYDPKAKKEKPTWFLVDVGFVKKFKKIVSIEEIRKNNNLKNMKTLQKGSRLSITPLTKKEFEVIEKLSIK